MGAACRVVSHTHARTAATLSESEICRLFCSALSTRLHSHRHWLSLLLSNVTLSLSLSALPSAFCFVFCILYSLFSLCTFLVAYFRTLCLICTFCIYVTHRYTQSHTHACTYTLLRHSPLVSFTFCFFFLLLL